MLKITDAARVKEVEIPRSDLARVSGVFKDIVDSPAVAGDEPVWYAEISS
jgi:hypothetical protein